MGALDKLEGFLSTNGAKFYGLEPATETLTLVKVPQMIPVRVCALVVLLCPLCLLRQPDPHGADP